MKSDQGLLERPEENNSPHQAIDLVDAAEALLDDVQAGVDQPVLDPATINEVQTAPRIRRKTPPATAEVIQPLTVRRLKKAIITRAVGLTFLLTYIILIFFLTHVNLSGTVLDYRNLPSKLQVLDKAYHLVSYTMLSFLILFTCMRAPQRHGSPNSRRLSARRLLVLSFFMIGYACFDEFSQPYFNRNFEVLDLLANMIGIATGQLLFAASVTSGWRRKFDRLL